MLCLGNHDHKNRLVEGGFTYPLAKHFVINDEGRRIVVIHDPADIIDRPTLSTKDGPLVDNPDDVFVLYGHTHAICQHTPRRWYHMGVDTIGFAPRTLDDIVKMNMEERHGPSFAN
jgi:calcineurin-like phosphoesterase family protein